MSSHVDVLALVQRRSAAAFAMQEAAHTLSSGYAEFSGASAEIRALIPELVERVRVRARARAMIRHAGHVSSAESTFGEHQAVAAGNRAADDAERSALEGLTSGFSNGGPAENFAYELTPQVWALLSAAPTHAKAGHSDAQKWGAFTRIVEKQDVRLRDSLIAMMAAGQ
jgi:hypothetical protein